jgi:2-polyprenyl-3-methyl-5-hydroxy-6-metoxy-1,4-benzoquinol methylase
VTPMIESSSERFVAEAYALRARAVSIKEIAEFRERFNALCPWYATFLRDWLPANRLATIVDAPCGAGNLLFALQQLGYRNVRGIDGDTKQVGVAQGLGLAAERGDVFAVMRNLDPSSVDVLFSLDFIEHVEPQEAVTFGRLAKRALRDGGLLICRTPSADGPFGSHDRYNDVTHRWAMTANAARAFLELAGFAPTEVIVRQEAPVPYKWQNRLRLALFRGVTGIASLVLNASGIGAPQVWTRSMWLIARA